MDWLFSHPEDSAAAPSGGVGIEAIQDMSPANYELFALISHKGTSAQCGHYVAYVKREGEWALFNDSKVVHLEADGVEKAIGEAYLYVYRKV